MFYLNIPLHGMKGRSKVNTCDKIQSSQLENKARITDLDYRSVARICEARSFIKAEL